MEFLDDSVSFLTICYMFRNNFKSMHSGHTLGRCKMKFTVIFNIFSLDNKSKYTLYWRNRSETDILKWLKG